MLVKKISVTLLIACMLASCSELPNKKVLGTAGGAATGALIGAISGGTAKSTLIGAGMGAAAGFGVGYYIDKQEQELKAALANSGAKIERNGNEINIVLPEGVTFETNSASIDRGFYRPLDFIANSLVRYPESKIVVEGHTDSTGNPRYNEQLSQKRADAVKYFFS